MKIYLDCCCLNRPFDDLTQFRVRIEKEAIFSIIRHCVQNGWSLVSSSALDIEISKISKAEHQARVRELYAFANEHIEITGEVVARAVSFQAQGIKRFDSLHLALAEAAGCDAFLTTDDRLLRAAQRIPTTVVVSNPVAWLMEVLSHGEQVND